jgi:monoamine oxidase
LAGRTTRRELVRRGALVGAGAIVAPGLLVRKAASATAPRIVVVGAGLAGMTAAYRIWKRTGWRPTVYEAHTTIGGRTKTIRGLHGGQHAERGGTFISSGDRAIRSLVKELGLSLVDTDPIYPDGAELYYFDGKRRRAATVFEDEDAVQKIADAQFDKILWPATYNHKNKWNERFDHMTVAEWIERYTPNGINSIYGRYLKAYFETENGGSIAAASALGIIADFSAPSPNYDERWLVRGGSDRIVRRLRKRLPPGSVKTGMPLRAIRRNNDGTYACTFSSGSKLADVQADRVVLALPFSALRDVDFGHAGFGPVMEKAIRHLGMGKNSKLNLQFRKPIWSPRSSGDSLSDLLLGATWPGEVGQQGREGIMVVFNGTPFSTSYGHAAAHGHAPRQVVKKTLAALDRVFPGTSRAFIEGQAYLDYWPADPWIKGSYAFYKVGAFTTFAGVESKRQGNVHMAGEHTEPYGNKGLMNGAVASGERAAREILADYGQTGLRRAKPSSPRFSKLE